MDKVYKVVEEDLTSCYGHGSFTVKYALGKWASAKIGGLLCFSSEGGAKMFCDGFPEAGRRIFECLASQPVTLPSVRLEGDFDGHPFALRRLQLLWGGAVPLYPLNHVQEWPAGTVAYKRVKLVREL